MLDFHSPFRPMSLQFGKSDLIKINIKNVVNSSNRSNIRIDTFSVVNLNLWSFIKTNVSYTIHIHGYVVKFNIQLVIVVLILKKERTFGIKNGIFVVKWAYDEIVPDVNSHNGHKITWHLSSYT